jgi:hypothetical protein
VLEAIEDVRWRRERANAAERRIRLRRSVGKEVP